MTVCCYMWQKFSGQTNYFSWHYKKCRNRKLWEVLKSTSSDLFCRFPSWHPNTKIQTVAASQKWKHERNQKACLKSTAKNAFLSSYPYDKCWILIHLQEMLAWEVTFFSTFWQLFTSKRHLFITLTEDLPPRQSPVLSDHILEGVWGNSWTSLDIIFH